MLYSGDSLYQPNTASNPGFTLDVTGTPITLGIQPNPVGTVTVYAQVNGAFVIAAGPSIVGTPGRGGVTTFTQTVGPGVPIGSYYLYAVFQPAIGSTYGPGTSPQVLLVSK